MHLEMRCRSSVSAPTEGEVIRSSQKKVLTPSRELTMPSQPAWLIWVVSFGVWTFVTLADAGSIYELYRSTGGSMHFPNVLGMECSQILTYFPPTPFVFALAIRYPVQKGNWLRRFL